MDNGRIYFYSLAWPERGAWVDGDDFNTAEDVVNGLEGSGILNGHDRDGRIAAAEAEGLASLFLLPDGDFDLYGYVDCRDCEEDNEAKAAFIQLFGRWSREDFELHYEGRWGSWEAYAREQVDSDMWPMDIPKYFDRYFDYRGYARELQEAGESTEFEGHFFFNPQET